MNSLQRFFLIGVSLLTVVTASGATITVLNTANSGTGSLRQAVVSASPGDTIVFTNTLSGQTIVLTSGSITLNKAVTIDASALPNGIAIDGNRNSPVLVATATVTLTALTITNGYDPNGFAGGIESSGTLIVNRCSVVGNFSSPGPPVSTAPAIQL